MAKNIEDAEASSFLQSKGGTTNHFHNSTIQAVYVCNDFFSAQNGFTRADGLTFPTGPQMPPTMQQTFSPGCITNDLLGRAIKAVQKLFWGQSSYAVIYCTLRDAFHHEFGMRTFEDIIKELSFDLRFDFKCPRNTISSTFYNHNYMKMHIDKWTAKNVKARTMNLVRAFIAAVLELIQNH